jgi:outer membrane protein TolC
MQTYGKDYLHASVDELIAKAYEHDAEIRIQQRAMENAIEKKRLNERGTWDTFLNLSAERSFRGDGTYDDDTGYSAYAAFNMRRVDSCKLNYAQKEAQAEIEKFRSHLEAARIAACTDIRRQVVEAKTSWALVEQRLDEIETRRTIFKKKLARYRLGKETVDNLIAADRQLISSEKSLHLAYYNYFKSIAALDDACGVYFEQLGITLNGIEP